MKACFWRAANKGYHNQHRQRLVTSDVRNSQYVLSGADGGSVDEQFYGVRQIPLSFFVLVEHDGKLAEMAKLPEPSRSVTARSAAIHANRTCLL